VPKDSLWNTDEIDFLNVHFFNWQRPVLPSTAVNEKIVMNGEKK
jgi:hypothetical protein